MSYGAAWRLCAYIWGHPANRGRRAAALARAVAWQLDKRLLGRTRVIAFLNGMRFRCYPDSTIASLVLYCHGLPDYHEMTFMSHYLRPGDGFIDVGANIGVYSLLAGSIVGPEGRVDAFEPGPVAVQRLAENVALNRLSWVAIHRTAVGAEQGTIPFTGDQDVLNRMPPSGTKGNQILQVPCVSLDDVLRGHRYAMAKMDIEGAEPLAVRGAQHMFADANPPVWLIEINGKLRDYGYGEEDFARWLHDRDYDVALYDADRRTLVFREQPWREHDNVFAIARSHRAHVRDRITSWRPPEA